jgi:hypothetical protein
MSSQCKQFFAGSGEDWIADHMVVRGQNQEVYSDSLRHRNGCDELVRAKSEMEVE